MAMIFNHFRSNILSCFISFFQFTSLLLRTNMTDKASFTNPIISLRSIALIICLLLSFQYAQAQLLIKTYHDSLKVKVLKEYYYVKSEADTIKNGEYIRYNKESKPEVSGYFKDGIKSGLWKEFYPDGHVKVEVPYINGIKNGTMFTYGLAGKVSSKGIFKDGKLQDSLFNYFSSGKIKSRAFFVNDWPDGQVKEYYSNGQLKLLQSYANQKPNGETKEFFEDGKPKLEALYENGILAGTYKTYYPEGGLDQVSTYDKGEKSGTFKQYNLKGILTKQGLYKKGRINGTCNLFYDSGAKRAELNYSEGTLDGTSIYFYENGVVQRKQTFRNDGKDCSVKDYFPSGTLQREYALANRNIVPAGTWKTYAKNGTLIRKESYDDNGKLSGSFTLYDTTGHQLRAEEYQFGVLNGVQLIYHANSSIVATRTEYISGRKNGRFIEQHKNGTKAIEGNYKTDLKIEVWNYYNTNGELIKEENWKNGKLGRTKTFTPKKKED